MVDRARRVVTLAVIAALVAPVALDRDSHPLSTYPMYAHTSDAQVTFTVATGYDSDERRVDLSIEAIADTDDPLIANARLRAVRDRRSAVALCGEILDRSDAATVEIAEEHHHIVDRVAGRESLESRHVLARCER